MTLAVTFSDAGMAAQPYPVAAPVPPAILCTLAVDQTVTQRYEFLRECRNIFRMHVVRPRSEIDVRLAFRRSMCHSPVFVELHASIQKIERPGKRPRCFDHHLQLRLGLFDLGDVDEIALPYDRVILDAAC